LSVVDADVVAAAGAAADPVLDTDAVPEDSDTVDDNLLK
jgi:hypothetical protein